MLLRERRIPLVLPSTPSVVTQYPTPNSESTQKQSSAPTASSKVLTRNTHKFFIFTMESLQVKL